jgi:hypothetical protein
MNEYDSNEEEILVDESLPAEPVTFSEKAAKAAPWWLISIFAHSVIAIICVFIVAVAAKEKDEELVFVGPPREVPVEPVKPKDKSIDPKPVELPEESDTPLVVPEMNKENIETPNDMEFQKAMGEALDNLTMHPFKSKSVNDAIGTGANAAGKYGGRFGGKELALKRGGGTPGTQDSVFAALLWLAHHQNSDGSWSGTKYVSCCGKKRPGTCVPNPGSSDFDTGLTGLSLLAFLGAGYTHLSREVYEDVCFGDTVKRALQYLMKIQDPSGRIGPDDCPKYMYNHLIAAFALCEAYGLTDSHLVRDAAQKAVDFTIQAQNPGKAWRYSLRCGDNDSSVSGWAVQVLKSAEVAGLNFPKEAYKGAIAWFDEVTTGSYGWTGYTDAREGVVIIPGQTERFANHPALSAISVMSRIFINKTKSDPRVRGGADRVMMDLPEWGKDAAKADFYYWYYASFAMFQFDGPEGSLWRKWNDKIKVAITDSQNKDKKSCKFGSWEPVDRWSCEGGRIYTTAMGALTMEVYYRYPAVMIDKKH